MAKLVGSCTKVRIYETIKRKSSCHLKIEISYYLVSIARMSLELGYISKINFIPKIGKDDETDSKSFRHNSLTFVLLKASTDTILYKLAEIIQNSLECRYL